MPASLIDGRAAALRLRARVADRAAEFRARTSYPPGLAVVLVGDDPASRIYVESKSKAAAEAGIQCTDHRLPATCDAATLLALVGELNRDPRVHGILVQLPLPSGLDAQRVLSAIDPAKDVDGFHAVNAGRLAIGEPALIPCTPTGCLILLQETVRELRGLNALVIGRSNIVGKPMAQLLLQQDCTVTIAHSRTRDLPGLCAQSDIVVAAIGRPRAVLGEWIKPGAVVIDVGINRQVDASGKSKIVGDVDFASAVERASAITPVPGGVGPMTIACLMMNTVEAATRSVA
ncbi:MAG: bifunctional methylenetetrahydrofolate dehydrogenase/methenyltetrahydrofolate cyclohydrolase FolD [Steroidobacteraceae bacterium]